MTIEALEFVEGYDVPDKNSQKEVRKVIFESEQYFKKLKPDEYELIPFDSDPYTTNVIVKNDGTGIVRTIPIPERKDLRGKMVELPSGETNEVQIFSDFHGKRLLHWVIRYKP